MYTGFFHGLGAADSIPVVLTCICFVPQNDSDPDDYVDPTGGGPDVSVVILVYLKTVINIHATHTHKHTHTHTHTHTRARARAHKPPCYKL